MRDHTIIAEGWHAAFGAAHAERDLLEKFSGEIHPTDILYVNLEPCCHTGKTPPCTDIILKRGVKRLVYGLRDPDRRAMGKGIELLRSEGVEITGPVLRDECAWLNRGFLSVRENNRPWITVKSAHASDGSIAYPDGSPKRITSKEQDAWSHQFLRAKHDAILVGVQTVIKDDPSLTVRSIDVPVQPWRIIFDPTGRIPTTSKVLNDSHRDRTIVVTAKEMPMRVHIEEQGATVWELNCSNNVFDFQDFFQGCVSPYKNFYGITSMLVEGGQRTWKSFQDHQMVDMEVRLAERMTA